MATAVLPNNDFETNIDDNHLEIFCLIWLDININVEDTRNTEQKLRSIINRLKKFQDVKQCQQYIEQRSKDRLVLIVSGQMGRQIVPSIHKLRQIISIYVYCMDRKRNKEWAYKFTKVKGVSVEFDELISQITSDHKIQKKVEEPLSINIFTTSGSGKSTTGVNGQFVFSQLLIDCLLRLKSTQIDRNELINLCKTEYEQNEIELNNLREFEQDYLPDKVLWWYTRESFFYKTLNTALRTQNIHMIFLFREYISNIHRQLQSWQSQSCLRVYRSQLMSNDELNGLTQNIGQFISVNSFFSTSEERTTVLFFLGDITSPIGLERVLFEIDADPIMATTKPFADISNFSNYTNESEVLFMLGSIFRLNSIHRNDDQIWIIRMTLCSDDEHDLRQVLMHMKQQIGNGETNLRTLGTILWQMGKLDLAEKYFSRLLKELPSNDPLLGSLYEDLGQLASQRGDYDMSVEWRQKSLKFTLQNQSSTNPNIIGTKNSIEQEILSSTQLNTNTKWKQDGLTIAGGNGCGNELNQLSYPYGFYVDDNNKRIYIADSWNNRIVEWKYNATNGQVVAGGNGQGNRMNQLNHPTDVIADEKNDSLIICDYRNRRVVQWPRRNGTNGQIIISGIDCSGITMDNNGFLYISDWTKNEVRRCKIVETNGTVVAGGNGKGNNLNQLDRPTYLFVDQEHSVYVSDSGNDRVMKWMKGAKEGIVVAGGQGEINSPAQLYYPQGVIVDQSGHVYVADCNNDRIMVWSKGSKEGRIVVGANGEGNQSNQFHCPRGLLFDRQGHLYVADEVNHRVQKFPVDFRNRYQSTVNSNINKISNPTGKFIKRKYQF